MLFDLATMNTMAVMSALGMRLIHVVLVGSTLVEPGGLSGSRYLSYDGLLNLAAHQDALLREARAELRQLTTLLHKAQAGPHATESGSGRSQAHEQTHSSVTQRAEDFLRGDLQQPLPPGPYNTTCKHCASFGQSLWCDCLRDSTKKWEQTSLTLSACKHGSNVTVTPGGFLACDWRDAPPPRVGNLTAGKWKTPAYNTRCRYISHTSFLAPEFKHPGDPIETIQLSTQWPWHDKGSEEERDIESVSEATACCEHCQKNPACKGWTVTTVGEGPLPPPGGCPNPPCPPPVHGHRVCKLVSQTATATASLSSYSGYKIKADASTWCEQNQQDLNTGVPPDVRCGSLAPKGTSSNASDFPRRWSTTLGPPGAGGPQIHRGRAWLFYPCTGNSSCLTASQCSCKHGAQGPSSMHCLGPAFGDSMQAQHIQGKPWSVFVHGGEFTWGNNIDQGYAILAAKQAAAGIGVLAVDYRTAPGANMPWDGRANNTAWPAAVDDIIQAAEWLTLRGASSVSLFGDSSGGTQVIQTLLMLAYRRRAGSPVKTAISSAVTYSAWLDLTCANPGYRTNAYCTASCLDAHSPDSGMHTAGWDSAKGQCAAMVYAGRMPLNHPLLSPVHAGAELLGDGHWPPTLLIVGGSEILMPETLEFAVNGQAAGAPLIARVYAGMFHDFQQYSQGCGSGEILAAGEAAFKAAGEFLLRPPQFAKLNGCKGGGGGMTTSSKGCDYAPVAWVSNFTKRPPIASEECNV